MDKSPQPLELTQLLAILRRRAPLVVLCILVMTAAAFALSKSQSKKYTATASLNFTTTSPSQQIAGLPASGVSGSSLLAQHANDVELVRLGDTAARTASVVGQGLTEAKVRKDVSVVATGESGVVSVSATAGTAALAARVANVYAAEFVR